MSKFTDSEGRVWRLRLTIGVMKKVLKDTDINLGGFNEQGISNAYMVRGDALQFVSVLFSMLESDIDKQGLSEHEFCELLHGDVYGAAQEAFWKAYLDFCPSQQRKQLQALEAKSKHLQETMMSKVEGMSDDELISLGTRMKRPASAGSTQTHSLNGS